MAKPKLCLIPSAQGDKFYSVLPSSGVGDFDFTRSGGATRINSQGLIETVADGVSRLNYPLIDGKVVGCPSHLLEPQRTNLITYSEDFSGYSAPNVTRVSNYGISPTGVLNATLIHPSSNTSNAGLYTSVSSSTVGVLSCFVKVNGKNFALLGTDNNINRYCVFDLVNETVVHEPSNYQGKIEKYKDGWYIITSTYTSSEAANYPFIGVADNSSGTVIADGSNGILIFGLQYEHEEYPTSYIPTTGSQATRSAETANNSGDASTFNDSEGVLMAEISALADDGTARVITINDGGSSDYIGLRYHTVSNTIRFLIKSGGTTNFDYFITLPSTEEYNKIAIKYDNTNVYLWANGFEYFQFSPIITPIGLSTLDFDDSVGGDDFYGNTKQIQYYDSALTDSELEKISSWTSFSDMAQAQQYSII